MSATGEPHPSAGPELGYRVFLLRCWQEAGAGPEGEPAWRFVLTQPGDENTRHGFASLAALVAFLRKELSAASRGDRASGL